MKFGFKGTLVAGTVFAAASMASPMALAADSLTVVSWGGAYTKSQVEAYHKPFTAKKGINIVSEDYNGGIAEIKAQVEAGNVTWDVVDVELSDAVRACDEGLPRKSTSRSCRPAPDGTPARTTSSPVLWTHDCAVANIVWSTVYAYDSSKMDDKQPTTIG
jgi:putative spermidine/putrescine transport system substrate-binding protein